MSRHTTLYILWSFILDFIPWIICSKKLVYLSLLMSPHRKEIGEIVFLKFFHGDWRRCTMSYPRMVKTISLGMWTSPLDLSTLGLHMSNFCFSIIALYRINLERIFVCFVCVGERHAPLFCLNTDASKMHTWTLTQVFSVSPPYLPISFMLFRVCLACYLCYLCL